MRRASSGGVSLVTGGRSPSVAMCLQICSTNGTRQYSVGLSRFASVQIVPVQHEEY